MDKRTLMAVVLSVVVITAGFMIQNALYPPEAPPAETAQPEQAAPEEAEDTVDRDTAARDTGDRETPEADTDTPTTGARISASRIVPVERERLSRRDITVSTDLLQVTIDSRGAQISQFLLKEHTDTTKGTPVDMVFNPEGTYGAFRLHFGGPESPAIDAIFDVRVRDNGKTVEFFRDFYIPGQEDQPFTISKTYRFVDGEYLFELDVAFQNSVNQFLPSAAEGYAYTLAFGPQIGPEFEELDNRNEYRRYFSYRDGDRDNINLNRREAELIEERVDWLAIVGKYFAFIGIPDPTEYDITVTTAPVQGLPAASEVYFARPPIQSSTNVDTFRFYLGPKITRVLARYSDAEENAWGISEELEAAVDSRFLLGWLENVLKFLLNLIHGVVPNYGVAIIILTIIVKVLMFPLTKKSYESTARMQEMSPKINELREKYKDNPQKLNSEMAAVYKKEGINPLGGCLPMLLQFPFFIAMFGLFNNHFDLRGATFIPGWINDLSSPESIWNFGEFTLPLLGWNDLRLLPILFVATQLVTSKTMQTPQASAGNMKMMTYMLPIVFFFVLYNMPSGLLVYWIVTNVLTAGQQYFNRLKKHSA
jgi:YidC/Oxa1 family membrane protein insertase